MCDVARPPSACPSLGRHVNTVASEANGASVTWVSERRSSARSSGLVTTAYPRLLKSGHPLTKCPPGRGPKGRQGYETAQHTVRSPACDVNHHNYDKNAGVALRLLQSCSDEHLLDPLRQSDTHRVTGPSLPRKPRV